MIVSSEFWNKFKQYQGCYLGGPKRTGKTLASVCIAEELKLRWRVPSEDLTDKVFTPWRGVPQWRVYANFPLVYNDDLTDDLISLDGPGLHHALVIVDEAGSRWANARSWGDKQQQDALSVVDYAGKQRLFFVSPSASTIDKKLREFNIFRNLFGQDFLARFGLGDVMWSYSAHPIGNKPFFFFLFFPYAYYGLYETLAIPGPTEDAVLMLVRKMQDRYKFDAARAAAASAAIEQQIKETGSYPLSKPSAYLAGGVPHRGRPRQGRRLLSLSLNRLLTHPFFNAAWGKHATT